MGAGPAACAHEGHADGSERDDGEQDAGDGRAGLGEAFAVSVPVIRVGFHGGVLAQGPVADLDLLEACRVGRVAVDLRAGAGVGLSVTIRLAVAGLVAVGGLLVSELVGDGAFDERRAGDLHTVGVLAALLDALQRAGDDGGLAGLEHQGVPIVRILQDHDLAFARDGLVDHPEVLGEIPGALTGRRIGLGRVGDLERDLLAVSGHLQRVLHVVAVAGLFAGGHVVLLDVDALKSVLLATLCSLCLACEYTTK